MYRLETLRTIEKENIRVEFVAWEEDLDPADTVAFGEDDESKKAEAEYLAKIHNGEYPWYCLGVHIFDTSDAIHSEVGASYLGGVDTYDLRGVGVRDVVWEAVKEARECMRDRRLRRAGPAMLEALELMVGVFNNTRPDPLQAFVAIEQARGAIAQAKGESHA